MSKGLQSSYPCHGSSWTHYSTPTTVHLLFVVSGRAQPSGWAEVLPQCPV